jgi:hypothetical protein
VDQLTVFGNVLPEKAVRKAVRLRRWLEHRFPTDRVPERYGARVEEPATSCLGIRPIGDGGDPIDPEKGIVLGTIRMGYGHYRISLALASAANSMGLTPYWLDLLSFKESRGAQAILYLENLYNVGSRLSQRSRFFNRVVWEKITGDSGMKLASIARDFELCRLFVPMCTPLPKDAAFVSTHPWTARAAVQAGVRAVVSAVPDNLPMAFHLAPGSMHAVQTPSAYFGYRSLRNMGEQGEMLVPMPDADIRFAGHFVDHEIVTNIQEDCERRVRRVRDRRARRVLLTVGGAGAQVRTFASITQFLAPYVQTGKAVVFLNMGDHRGRWDEMKAMLDDAGIAYTLREGWEQGKTFAEEAGAGEVGGVNVFLSESTFPAVYLTNMLMRASDMMVTKPSELSFYPVPKLFIQRVGRHEAWGAIRGAEIGDSTMETESSSSALAALKIAIEEDDLIPFYCRNIVHNHTAGVYDGAYNVIKLARDYRTRLLHGERARAGAAIE